MHGFIYITTNLVNGKKYIGQCKYSKSWHEKYLGSGKAIRRAISKYGSENFSREVICECETQEDLTRAENFYLKYFNAAQDRNWYNIQAVAYSSLGFLGKHHTPERNQLVAEKLKGRKRPPHVGEAVSRAQKNRIRPEVERKQQGQSLKERWADPEFKARMLEARRKARAQRLAS